MLLDQAGEPDHQPELPERGIPRRLLPTWLSTPIKWAALPFVLLDLRMQRLARMLIRPPHTRAGACKKRGNCCYYILLRQSRGPLKWFFHFWATQIHGFYYRDRSVYEHEGKRVRVMGCRYLKSNGQCGNYRLRPMICRKWPLIEIFGEPRVLKGCGYHVKEKEQC